MIFGITVVTMFVQIMPPFEITFAVNVHDSRAIISIYPIKPGRLYPRYPVIKFYTFLSFLEFLEGKSVHFFFKISQKKKKKNTSLVKVRSKYIFCRESLYEHFGKFVTGWNEK